MHRRRYLRSAGTVAVLGLAGCVGGDSSSESTDDPVEPTERRPTGDVPASDGVESDIESIADDWGFDEVLNLSDAGADTDGDQPIDGVLDDYVTGGTLVYLPPGRYRVADVFSIGDGSNLGIVGYDATIVPADGYSSTLFGLGWPESLGRVLVSGLTFDFSAPDTGGRPLFAAADDRIVLRDLSVRGEIDVEQDVFRLDVTGENGTGLVERIRLPDGAVPGTGVTGCEVGDRNHGDISFVDCHIEGFPDNGLYANPPDGSIEVQGGYFRNNGIAGVRIETNEDSVVRGAHVRCDEADGSGQNMRGIRLRAGKSLLVEDCVVELLEVTESDGAITFASELESATVRNCRVRVDADNVNAIRVKSPPDDASSDTSQGPFRCEGVVITGSASEGAAIQAANREGCEFHGLCVNQPGVNRDGFQADNVVGELVDSRIAVTGEPLAFQNSAITRRDVTLSRNPDNRKPCR